MGHNKFSEKNGEEYLGTIACNDGEHLFRQKSMKMFNEYKNSFDKICDKIKSNIEETISAEIQNKTLMQYLL